ncbi:MAG TPA: FRG domain-containing protein [Aestuariivirgaceae bacterium]|nr:FRG domain-containing protein [Aestuariivirgaceae bacterium]
MDAARRRQIIFRGHNDARWPLVPTLDRYRRFTSDDDREQTFGNLLRRFRREMLHVDESDKWMLLGNALELMARHHGLPTPLLDWTESPYIAAFFAFSGVAPDASQVAIWMLDRKNCPKDRMRL